MQRVVVTGIGSVSPIGNTFQESYKAAKEGLSGLGPVTRFDVSDIPWRVAGELKHFDPGGYLSAKELKRLDPFVQYAVVAAVSAAEDAGLISSFIPYPSSLSSARCHHRLKPRGHQHSGGGNSQECSAISKATFRISLSYAGHDHQYGAVFCGAETRSKRSVSRYLKCLRFRGCSNW